MTARGFEMFYALRISNIASRDCHEIVSGELLSVKYRKPM